MKIIKSYPKRGQYDRTKSKPNSGIFQKGHKGMKEENNPMWKGDSVGYTALHDWLYLKFGQPKFCEGCGKEDKKKYEWANLSGLYKRVKTDWIRLCTSCHMLLDGQTYKMLETRRLRSGKT